MRFLGRLKLKVNKRHLFLPAGIMWSGVGGYLSFLAYTWLKPLPIGRAVAFSAAGIVLAFAIYHFGFSKIAKKNIKRIFLLDTSVSILVFQSWQSYLIVPIMIGLGIFLRHSSLPKPYLALMYTGIGGGLFLSSLRYYFFWFRGEDENSDRQK